MGKFERIALGGKGDVKQILICRETPRRMARGEGQEAKCTLAMIYNNTAFLLSLELALNPQAVKHGYHPAFHICHLLFAQQRPVLG